MIHRCLPLSLPLFLFGLSIPGCQETNAPAASSPRATQTANSDQERFADRSNPTPAPAADVGQDAGDEKPAVGPEKKPEPPAKTRDYSFDDLKFDIEKDGNFKRDMLTDKIEAMVDTPIRIRGYILPSFQQTGLTQFVLVRDNLECCFGPGAALFDCILVEMKDGTSADFSVRPVAVEGKFSINEFIGPDGKHLAIFHLRGEAVTQ